MRTILYNEVRMEVCNAAALGAYSAMVGSVGIDPIQVGDVFNSIKGLNTSTGIVSSLGEYVTEMSINLSQNEVNRIMKQVPHDSLAYKILNSDNNFSLRRGFQFSDKQLWAISFELMKNKNYTNKIGAEKYKKRLESDRKYTEQRTKLKNNKSNSQTTLDFIKSKNKKLGDYYKWLNSKENPYRKEYFTKKFSLESARMFVGK